MVYLPDLLGEGLEMSRQRGHVAAPHKKLSK